jgi:hypothetical protein
VDWKTKLRSLIDPKKPAAESEPEPTQLTASQVINIVSDFVYLAENIQAQYDFNYQQVGNTDQETSELLHEIEIISLDACYGWKILRDVKKVRQDRRYYKDQNAVIGYMANYINQDSPLTRELRNLLAQMNGKIEYQANRVYHPKIRQDLRCATREEN